MQEKSIFLVKNQQVECEKMRNRWGLTEKEKIIAWNYEENREGLGRFFRNSCQNCAGDNWLIFCLKGRSVSRQVLLGCFN
jgi:hypothetical protein